MKEIISTVTSKGQVTIPSAVRKHLGIVAGSKLVFAIGDEGGVELHATPYSTVASLRGAAGSLEKPRSWDEMRAIAREDRHEGTRSRGV